MRRNNASRPIVRRRNNRRRRRPVALRGQVRRQAAQLRKLTLPLGERAGLLAVALCRFGSGVLFVLNALLRVLHALLHKATLASARAALQSVAALGRSSARWAVDGGRRLLTALRVGLSWVSRRGRTILAFPWGTLKHVLAAMRHVAVRFMRWPAGGRLPEIPGGDPVLFGVSVGAAIVLLAGLVVLVGSQLRPDTSEPQAVAYLTEPERDRHTWEWTPAPHERRAAPGDVEAEGAEEPPHLAEAPADSIPAAEETSETTVAQEVDVAPHEDENLAAAMPLLEMPEEPPEDLALSTPARPTMPTLPEARPFAAPEPPQWLANAIEPRLKGRGPMIAIVIDDAGVAEARSARAIELPPPLTIAFIPYSRNLEAQTRRARQNGHELLVHIPMEPGSGAADPGYNALLTGLDRDEIMRRFRWGLSRFDGYVGVNNHMGSKFMARADLVEPLLAEMNARGLMFLDSRTDSTTVGARLAAGMGLPHASRNVFLDNELDADKIAAQLAQVERVARRRGHAVAIGHPHDVTVDVLAEWIPKARARGFALVPVSAIVKLEYGDDAAGLLAAASGGGEPDGLLGSPQ